MTKNRAQIQSVRLDDENDALILLDQTKLPNEIVFLSLKSVEEIRESIRLLQVRGAPAIGIAAAYGLYLGIKQATFLENRKLAAKFSDMRTALSSARPTAVNLFWALERMQACFDRHRDGTAEAIVAALKNEANSIRLQDAESCEAIGRNALSLLQPGWGVLTHCNAGAIATTKYGTALAPIYLGEEKGYRFHVYADETRPLLQGARLTAWELQQAGIDVTLICDNMAASVMKEGRIQAVLVGCDRVAANGDTANKIGTLSVAILAKHFQIPFFVCAPMSTIDLNCNSAEDIEIEIRKPEEITEQWYQKRMAPQDVHVYNPCFDVTDNELITAIITEKGIAYPPYRESLSAQKRQESCWNLYGFRCGREV